VNNLRYVAWFYPPFLSILYGLVDSFSEGFHANSQTVQLLQAFRLHKT
jgi:hypothetical protein